MPRLLRFVLASVLAALAAMALLRLGFFLAFRDRSEPVTLALVAEAFRVGGKFDLRLALLAHLPLLLLGAVPRLSPFRSVRLRRCWAGYLAAVAALVLVVYAFDFGHYAYLELRLDATVLRFLYEPTISAGMIRETYSVPLVLAAILAGAALAGWAAARGLARAAALPPLPRARRLLAGAAAAAVVAGGLWGKLQWYPLRWVDAYFSTSPFASALALNPVLYFAATWKNRAQGWDEGAARAAWPVVADYVGAPPAGALSLRRPGTPAFTRAEPPNVVLVILESFATFKTGFFGNPLDPTPHFDALARESLVFTRFHTPHAGTARSVFAALTGLPDVERVRTSSRNPLAVRQETILNAFEGYDKYFFMGGSANWGNIRGLLVNNVPGLVLQEEGDHDAPRVNVWGISDFRLVEEAHAALAGPRPRPFLAIIKTSGSHRPYTIPRGESDFQSLDRTDAEARRFGFVSAAEYNAFRYLDHVVGRLMALARREPWYANTIFVLFGDHGLGPRGAEHLTPAEQQLEVTKLHVPLVLHAPALLGPPRTDSAVASELDLLPTVASAAGVPYVNTTLGRDLFDPARVPCAFTIRHGGEPTIGLLCDRLWFRMRADGSEATLHGLEEPDPHRDLTPEHPAETVRMRELTVALYEAARWLTFHNAPADQVAGRGR